MITTVSPPAVRRLLLTSFSCTVTVATSPLRRVAFEVEIVEVARLKTPGFTTTLFAYLFSIVIGIGLVGVWWGIIIANLSGGIITFLLARNIIKQLLRKQTLDNNYKNSFGDL